MYSYQEALKAYLHGQGQFAQLSKRTNRQLTFAKGAQYAITILDLQNEARKPDQLPLPDSLETVRWVAMCNKKVLVSHRHI